MEFSQILGWVATILFSAMFIPQIVKTLKMQSIDDVSLWMFIVGLVANIDALYYATLIHQVPLQIKYSVALVAISIYLFIYYKIQKRK